MKILIVTPDFKEIIVSGLWGWFYKIYRQILVFQLKFLFRRYPQAQVLTSKSLFGSRNALFYDDLVMDVDFEHLRKKVWQFVRNYYKKDFIWGGVSINKITETRSAIHFALSVFPYFEVIENLIFAEKPDLVLTLTRDSIPEKIALKIANEAKIKTKTILVPNVSIIDRIIDYFLRLREANLRVSELFQAQKEKQNFERISQNRVLIEASHPLQLKSALPLISKTKNSFLITHLTNSQQELGKLANVKVNWAPISSFLKQEEIQKIYQVSQNQAKSWWNKIERANSNNFVFDLSKNYLKNTAIYYFPIAAVLTEAVRKIFEKTKPTAAIVFSDRGFIDGAMATIAKKFQIPSFLVSPNTNMSVDKTNSYDICDFVTVPGVHLKSELIKIGHRRDNIFVVGDLRFDNLPKIIGNFDKRAICQRIGVDPDKKIVLLISFHLSGLISAEEKKILFQSTSKVISKLRNVQLLIRPHPNEPTTALKSEVSQWKIKNGKIEEKSSLYELLYIADLVVMVWSMTGFEAMVFEKPVVTVNFYGKDYNRYIPYASQGAVIEAKNERELEVAIKTLLFNQKARENLLTKAKKFSEFYLGTVDGEVAERIIALINQKTLKR